MAKRGPKEQKEALPGWYVWDSKTNSPYIYLSHRTEKTAEETRLDLLKYHDPEDPWYSRLTIMELLVDPVKGSSFREQPVDCGDRAPHGTDHDLPDPSTDREATTTEREH